MQGTKACCRHTARFIRICPCNQNISDKVSNDEIRKCENDVILSPFYRKGLLTLVSIKNYEWTIGPKGELITTCAKLRGDDRQPQGGNGFICSAHMQG